MIWLFVLFFYLFKINFVYSDNSIITNVNNLNNARAQNNASNDNGSNTNNVNLVESQRQHINVNNKIINFQVDKALNVNFNDIQIDDGVELLHSDDEYQVLYNRFIKQNIRIDSKQKRTAEQEEDDDGYIKETNLKLSSLYYYNDNDWGCKINNRFIKKKNQNEAHGNVSIVKVNKDNVLFVLNRTKKEDLEKVKKLKKSKYRYNNDYYIVKNGDIQSVMFRLHIGQSINLKNFKIN